MNVIIDGAAIPGDGDGETEVLFNYGKIPLEVFDLNELVEVTDTHDSAHRVMVWDMNSDQKERYDATGIAAVQYRTDPDVDRLFFGTDVIDGPFLLMMTIGDKFKAFHCETCAGDFVKWFMTRQPTWRSNHGTLGISAATPKKSYQ